MHSGSPDLQNPPIDEQICQLNTEISDRRKFFKNKDIYVSFFYLNFITTDLPAFGLPHSCLSKIRVVVQDERHLLYSVKYDL